MHVGMEIEDYGPLLTAEAFLEIEFGERIKAELDEGRIAPLIRGPRRRVQIAGNLLCFIMLKTKGHGFSTYGSLLMVKTGVRSVRFPDVAVYRAGQEPVASDGDRDLMCDPVVAVHVRTTDASEGGRLRSEYCALPSMQALVLVDHVAEDVHVIQRTTSGAWLEERIPTGGDAVIPCLDLVLPHAEIFARD